MQNIALVTLLLPFVGALIAAFSCRKVAKSVCVLFSLLATLGTLCLAWHFYAGGRADETWQILNYGNIAFFGFTIDRVSTLIGFAVVFLGLLISYYSTAYLSKNNREHPDGGDSRYYALLLVFIGAMAGLVYSSTILGQLLFFEITGGCSWGLIGYYQSEKSQKAAMKALLMTHVASIGLYIAAATLFVQTGSFALSGMASLDDQAMTLVMGGIMFAAWGKSAQLPLQAWLPSAMEAPTPVSAYLHAASMVKVGVYVFARGIISAQHVPSVIGWVGLVMAMITMIYGFLMYLPQKDMKRLLAWSTITQLAYMFVALSLAILGASRVAYDGGIAYIFNHAFAKSLFFLVAGAFSYTCGTRMLPQLKGVMRKFPLLGVSFCIAALAIAGVPPFNGFFSKFPIFAAGFQLADQYWVMYIVMVLILIESVASFAWLIYWFGRVVPGEASTEVESAVEVPLQMKVVLTILIIMSVCSSVIASMWLN